MTKNKRRRKSKRRKNSFEHKPLPKISAQKGSKTLKGQFKKLMSGDRGKTPVSRRISGKANYRLSFYEKMKQWFRVFKNSYKHCCYFYTNISLLWLSKLFSED